jgi:uncharacterized protein YeeX (DUF496 family)
MELLEPKDFWNIISHPWTPIERLLEIWKHLENIVTPNFKKIFFVSVRDNLLAAENSEKVLSVVEMLKEFYDENVFLENIYFNMLYDLDIHIKEAVCNYGFLIDLDKEYVILFKKFSTSKPLPSQAVTGWGEVPLPVQRRLAKRGYFLNFFVCHPIDPIALECLSHLLIREDVIEFVRIASINAKLLSELSKEQKLFRDDIARYVLVANPKTQANVVLNHINHLKSYQLRKLAHSKESNRVAQSLAKNLLLKRR